MHNHDREPLKMSKKPINGVYKDSPFIQKRIEKFRSQIFKKLESYSLTAVKKCEKTSKKH